jgi:hypothetical protein
MSHRRRDLPMTDVRWSMGRDAMIHNSLAHISMIHNSMIHNSMIHMSEPPGGAAMRVES